jgi:hypothetical protein
VADPTGIPTIYRGVQFRSRLEAKWAAMFDLLGWTWQYEPCDFPGWIPDFALTGKAGNMVLVEVKPVVAFPRDVADEIDRACPGMPWDAEYDPDDPAASTPDREVLIVGCAIPIHPSSDSWTTEDAFGWLRQDGGWAEAAFGRWEDGHGSIGFCHTQQSFNDRISGGYDGGSYGGLRFNMAEAKRLWDQAGNATQWKSPRRAWR